MPQAPITERFEKFQQAIASQYTLEGIAKIVQAFQLQLAAYGNTYRPSGEHYLVHNIGVAQTVACEMKRDAEAVVAALLHNYLHNPAHQLATITAHFGPTITTIIKGLHAIYQAPKWRLEDTVAYLEKLHDICVTAAPIIFVALAEQLNKMRNLKNVQAKQQKYAIHLTKYVYTPLAHRLSLPYIKTEFEDLCFKYTNHCTYYDIASKLRTTKNKRNDQLQLFTQKLTQCLDAHYYEYIIKKRTKSIFSIWQKLRKGIAFDNIYDLSAVRVITKENPPHDIVACYDIYETIKEHFTLKPGRFKNWIAYPKPNGYESLHMTVANPYDSWVEVQIRTQAMDQIAEAGKAAHWQYKNMEDPTQHIPAVSQWLSSLVHG